MLQAFRTLAAQMAVPQVSGVFDRACYEVR